MEIYINSAERDVALPLPVTPDGGTLDVLIYDNDALVYTVPTLNYDNNQISFTLPFFLVNSARKLKVTWSISYVENTISMTYNNSTYVYIVIPLVTVNDARLKLDIPASITDAQIANAERMVRRIIEQVTGQVFAPVQATYKALRLRDGSLLLPQRLVSLTSVEGVDNTLYYVLANGGWSLSLAYPNKRDGLRAGWPDHNNIWTSIAPITPPEYYDFKPYYRVDVNGLWGYEQVPSDIYEAALILIEQKLCPDSLYQERYVSSMTSADFRYQLADEAYFGTGNVVVDHLLVPYTVTDPAVI